MTVPGSNLLVDALDLIESQTVSYLQATGSTTTPAGRKVPAFAAPVSVTRGSLQPIPKSRYQFLGLDLTKEYVIWYVSRAVVGVARDTSGDRIVYAGRTFQLQSLAMWFAQDGWVAATCVEIDPNA